MRFLLILANVISLNLFSQVNGFVKDDKATPLAFVNVYVDDSEIGTSTNSNGFYKLDIEKPGTYTILYQYLGFETFKKKVTITKFPHTIDVSLNSQQIYLEPVTITKKVNPAVQIIKNSIAARDQNTAHLNFFSSDFYSKGLMRIKNAPKKILGSELRFPFPLDSTRSGIIYLSETISKIYSQKKPEEFKEHILASKISGEDKGISFNSAEQANFNIYANQINIDGVKVFSPISPYSFSYYDYNLKGTFYDSNGFKVYKIKLLPKQKNTPTYNGFIYVVDGIWAIYGVDFSVSGKQLSHPFITTLKLKQDYKYDSKLKVWNKILQTIDFEVGLLGLNMNGRFSASYSNYTFKKKFDKKTFTNQVLSYDKNATTKDSIFWKGIRPIPLTKEEGKDYKVKHSAKLVVTSQKYLDSIDVKSNRFSLSDILFGYRYSNTYKKYNFVTKNLFSGINYNPVQGFNTNLHMFYSKRFNEIGKRINVSAKFNYGLSDKKLRPVGGLVMNWNETTRPVFSLFGGNTVLQFDSNEPISKLENSVTTLFFKENFISLYEKDYIKSSFSTEIYNGIRLISNAEYASRKPLKSVDNYSFFLRDKVYQSNNPISSGYEPCFSSHEVFIANIGFDILFGNKYMSYPNLKVNRYSKKYPKLRVNYRKIFSSAFKEYNSDLFSASLSQDIELGLFGDFNYAIEGFTFKNKKNIPFMDYIHPLANKFPLVSSKIQHFKLLDYYKFSTNDKQVSFFIENNFNGSILSRIPLINKLNVYLVGGVKSLYTANRKPYTEFSIGIENIGFGKWRFLRVDYVKSVNGIDKNDGFVFGIRI